MRVIPQNSCKFHRITSNSANVVNFTKNSLKSSKAIVKFEFYYTEMASGDHYHGSLVILKH